MKTSIFATVFFLLSIAFLPSSYALDGIDQFLHLVTPQENAEIVSKKPEIEIAIPNHSSTKNLMVLLDNVDITSFLISTNDGLRYTPPFAVPPGLHHLHINLITESGLNIQRDFAFSTKQEGFFDEAYSNNNLDIEYEGIIKKPTGGKSVNYSSIDSLLQSYTGFKKNQWEVSFNTNLLYTDQTAPTLFPREKGVNVANYNLSTAFQGKQVQLFSEVGDLRIHETLNTVQNLERRGGKLALTYKGLEFSTFAVNSKKVYGENGGTGISLDSEDHIQGVSGKLGLFSNRIQLRSVYVTGGEKGSSFSIQTLDQNKEGNVIGFEAKAKIIPYTLEFEAEYDRSRFDFSTDDEFSSTSDTAYIVKIGGKSSIYTYEATYQYSGPDYAVIGNPQALRDRAGILVLAGANTHSHDLHIFASRYFDNVKKDPLFPRVTMYNWALDYSFSGIKSLPFGVGFEQSLLGSALEPTSFEPVQFDTNTASARVSYLRKRWDFRFRTSYSSQNDRSPQENDISSESFTVSPLYQWKNLVIFPNFTFIRTHFDQTKSRTDFFTVTLDLRGETLSEKVTYNLAATFSKGEATNGDLDQRTFSSDFRLSYKLPEKYFGYLAPAAAIRGKYNKTTDYVTNQKNDELTLWLALDANVPFSF